jgi:hypothetical protein
MRNVVKSNEIAHLWYHHTQDSAKCPSSMSFAGPNFYSYSTVVASKAKAKDKSIVVLLTSRHYSVTTSSHLSTIRQSVPNGVKTFYVDKPETWKGKPDHRANLDSWKQDIERALIDAANSREPKKSRLVSEAQTILDTMRDYAATFGVRYKFPKEIISKDELAAYVAATAKRKADAERNRAKMIERQNEQRRIEYTADREAWLNGNDAGYHWASYFPCELRIVGDEIETSKGVSFPLAHAKRGLALVESVIQSGEEWHRNGHTCHLGHYQIDRVTPDGTVYAGCHVVPYTAIARIKDAIIAYTPASLIA